MAMPADSVFISTSWGVLAACAAVFLVILLAGFYFVMRSAAQAAMREAKAQWRSDINAAVVQIAERINNQTEKVLVKNEVENAHHMNDSLSKNRQEVLATLSAFQSHLGEIIAHSDSEFRSFAAEQLNRTDKLSEKLSDELRHVSSRVDDNLKNLQNSNEAKLEKIRETVEEKLQSSLQQRVSESFKIVSSRLEEVFAGLTEMRNLASDVGSLKQVLVNVKNRGMLGEVQLESILSEYFTADQYGKNVHPVPNNASLVVEFAVRMPGKCGEGCWLPIDAKFPVEDYQRLQAAQEDGDRKGVLAARDALMARLLKEGKDISRYVNPPQTTDFAIMFLPSEGLYAEALSLPGLTERLYRESRVYVMGPSTLASALCAYRAGFQSIAIEKRSADIRRTLNEVRTEFNKFSEVLKALKRQLETASRTVDQAEVRTRQMYRCLDRSESTEDAMLLENDPTKKIGM